ncbi:ATP-binding protein [Ruania rhizosphaerae]|uniref:ATP-binding protein n=1 Tax=Ruania rhizosphaerae TaxID=1840413 RepID=UPI0013582AC3|nr:SbcC/MukB-like Walker B domain-containing protein [Ruania rhizosphaerae]
MTMLDTLFGMIPATSRGQQWVADEFQLVNWGGYEGAHRLKLSPEATLLVGGSGSGKSTLMDAYIALMMPHTTPFNGASNGGVTGRPRGQDQRNIVSYGRGKIDESRTEDGTQVRVLRGDGEDTWTAVAVTWIDHDGSRFTAVRAWYIPAGARLVDDTVKVRATTDGEFDLSSLESAAMHRLSDAAVAATGLDTVHTDREFTARLHSVLGIGAAGAGHKAMSLLARIQAGQQITTVDELYKRMVLEEPETLTTADAVVSHFDELESTRERMVTARKQVRTLEPIREMKARIEASADRLRLIDEVGRFTDPESPATLWRAQKRLGLLRDVESELQSRKRAADDTARAARVQVDAAEQQRDALAELLRAAGGDRLVTAERELRSAERHAEEVARERERFDQILDRVGVTAETAKQFESLVARARESLDDPRAKDTAREAWAAARQRTGEIDQELRELEAEAAQAGEHDGAIPTPQHEARLLLAEAAGLELADLPFVGELIEVRTEFEPWREAFNLALGGFATTLLIDQAHLDRFRRAIDSVPTRVRLRYEGVHTGSPRLPELDPRRMPGRLEFRESPFTGWLQDRLDQRFGFLCVDTAAELTRHDMAMTISGQISQGARGAHGGHGRRNVLGFSNHRRLDELSAAIADARTRRTAALEAQQQAAQALDDLDARHTAYGKIVELTWTQVDSASADAERDRWAGLIDDISTGNPEITKLQRQLAEVKSTLSKLMTSAARADGEVERLGEQWAHITDQVDDAQLLLDRAERAEHTLTEDQSGYLEERFAVVAPVEGASRTHELERFDLALENASRLLAEDQLAAQTTLSEQRDALQRTFESFLESWPNPNLRADPDSSYGDFERILTDLETSGLHELEAEWKDSLLQLSGNDLTNLDSALGRALREIRDRIQPINQIMADLPFYDDAHRLQIAARETSSEARRRFRRELREVRGLIDSAETDADREAVYGRMARLIARMRRSAPDFAELVDVRNHVRISAEKIHADTGEHAALYDHIGEKSGGESQELIAFIVGAALRYQLGDPDSERPRYAPVFLDEALIKADAHFTKRAIGAWRGLGFQLIIGAPNDKYSAIEPHVDVEYDILKDTRGRSWAKPKVALSG